MFGGISSAISLHRLPSTASPILRARHWRPGTARSGCGACTFLVALVGARSTERPDATGGASGGPGLVPRADRLAVHPLAPAALVSPADCLFVSDPRLARWRHAALRTTPGSAELVGTLGSRRWHFCARERRQRSLRDTSLHAQSRHPGLARAAEACNPRVSRFRLSRSAADSEPTFHRRAALSNRTVAPSSEALYTAEPSPKDEWQPAANS